MPDDVEASRARIVATSNAARRSLERRLHDGPQQHLVAMAVKLRLIESAIDTSPDQAKEMLAELRGEVQEAVQQLRDIASAIFPPLLGDRGLAEALRAAVARDAERSVVEVDAPGRYPTEVEAAVYFAIVEAMQLSDGPLHIAVDENGDELAIRVRGSIAESARLHLEDRVHAVGGTTTRSRDEVVATIPLA